MSRKHIPHQIQVSILVKSRRRCCICYGLNRDTALKAGQIAHLDHNASDSSEDNLAFLCLEHHDQYDSPARQSKGLMIHEVRTFRNELYCAIDLAFGTTVSFGRTETSRATVAGHYVSSGPHSSAEIRIERLGGNLFHVTGTALEGLTRKYGPHIGELDFISVLKNRRLGFNASRNDGQAYRVTVTCRGGRLTVEEENAIGVHGMGVSFQGQYEKAT